MIRLTIFILLSIGLVYSCNQVSTSEKAVSLECRISKLDSTEFDINKFKAFPDDGMFDYRASLLDRIQPSKDYVYWECLFKDVNFEEKYRGEIIASNGDSANYAQYAQEINPSNGFFVECHPLICYTYIIGVNDDNSTDLIDSEGELKQFIGEIDNTSEVILSVILNGYSYDSDTIIGGAFQERENDYLLYILEYSSWPVTYKSVQAILAKNGDFAVIDQTIYKQTEEYIIE